MEHSAQGILVDESRRPRKGGVICPSLILSYKVVCDKKGTMHQPTRAHLWEYCTTPLHSCCPLQMAATTPWEEGRGNTGDSGAFMQRR